VTPRLPLGPQPCNAFALIPGFPSSWPATLQPLCLGHEPKARVATIILELDGMAKVNEEMVSGWHASAFLCLLGVDSNMEGHVTSYSSQRVDDQSLDPEVGDGSIDHHDVHDDTLVLEFL